MAWDKAAWMRQWYKRRHARARTAVVALLGGRCIQCGFADARALCVDHIENGGSAERRKLGGTLAVLKKVLRDAQGYQLLCANCNLIKEIVRRQA